MDNRYKNSLKAYGLYDYDLRTTIHHGVNGDGW